MEQGPSRGELKMVSVVRPQRSTGRGVNYVPLREFARSVAAGGKTAFTAWATRLGGAAKDAGLLTPASEEEVGALKASGALFGNVTKSNLVSEDDLVRLVNQVVPKSQLPGELRQGLALAGRRTRRGRSPAPTQAATRASRRTRALSPATSERTKRAAPRSRRAGALRTEPRDRRRSDNTSRAGGGSPEAVAEVAPAARSRSPSPSWDAVEAIHVGHLPVNSPEQHETTTPGPQNSANTEDFLGTWSPGLAPDELSGAPWSPLSLARFDRRPDADDDVFGASTPESWMSDSPYDAADDDESMDARREEIPAVGYGKSFSSFVL